MASSAQLGNIRLSDEAGGMFLDQIEVFEPNPIIGRPPLQSPAGEGQTAFGQPPQQTRSGGEGTPLCLQCLSNEVDEPGDICDDCKAENKKKDGDTRTNREKFEDKEAEKLFDKYDADKATRKAEKLFEGKKEFDTGQFSKKKRKQFNKKHDPFTDADRKTFDTGQFSEKGRKKFNKRHAPFTDADRKVFDAKQFNKEEELKTVPLCVQCLMNPVDEEGQICDSCEEANNGGTSMGSSTEGK